MSKARSRMLYLTGIGISIIATILLIAGIAGSTTTTEPNGVVTVTSLGNPALFTLAIILYFIAAILGAIAWIGALIRTAQLEAWVWFVCLLLFSGITMLIYIFAGPTQPKRPAPVWSPPPGQPPYGYR